MSNSSIYLDSFSHAAKRFGNSAAVAIDPLKPTRHATLRAPVFPLKREFKSQTTADFDTEIVFKLPKSGYVHHIDVKFKLATTGVADYADYIAAVIPKTIDLRQDSNEIHKYEYAPAFNYYLSKCKSEEARDRILAATGGVNYGNTGGGLTVGEDDEPVAPIPTSFDPIVNPGCAPLNLSKLRSDVELVITTRPANQCYQTSATGYAITAAYIVLYMSETSPDLKEVHKQTPELFHMGIDFYTKVLNPVVTSTITDIDITGTRGLIKKILLINRLQTDVATGTVIYYANKSIDYVKTKIDGAEDFVFKSRHEGIADQVKLAHGKGFNSTIGYPYIIPFSYIAQKNYGVNNYGGMHASKFNKAELEVYHSEAGADTYIDVLAIESAIYKYENGMFIRFH